MTTQPVRLSQDALCGLIFEAAAQSELWPEVLDQIARACRARLAWLCGVDARSWRLPLWCLHGATPEFERQVADGYMHPEANELLARGMQAPAGVLFTMGSALPRAQLERSRVYREMVRPHDLEEMMVVNLLAGPAGIVSLSVFRSSRERPFSAAEQRAILRLTPHLARAVKLGLRLAEAGELRRATETVLEHLEQPALVVDDRGRLVFANRLARTGLRRSWPLGLRRGRLVLGAQGLQARFETLVARATAAAGLVDGGCLSLPGSPPRCLRVAPLMGPLPFSGLRPRALVLVEEPAAEPTLDLDRLCDLWGLTQAEARLCQAIACGAGLAAAARALGVSINTARTHLARVFDKTGTHRQAELVKLLALTPGLRAPPGPRAGSGDP